MNGFYLFLCLVLVSCGHAKLHFESYPSKVDVGVVSSDGQIRTLGQTPLRVNIDSVPFNDGAIRLMFTKDGFQDEVVYLSKPALSSTVKVSTTMKAASSAKEIIFNEKLEILSYKTAEAQRYSYSKNYNKAESILLDLIDTYPGVSVPYDLLANIYYLSNKTSKALFYYEKAKSISPVSPQREYLINKIKNEVGYSEGSNL